MMKTETILTFMGFGMILVSMVQWMWLYPDPSQFTLGIFLGVALAMLGYYGEETIFNKRKLLRLEHRLDSLVYDKKSEQELKAVKRGRK